MPDQVRQNKHWACEQCAKSDDRCKVCALPLNPARAKSLPDGRRYCEVDFQQIIVDQREAERLFEDAQRGLARLLAPWGALPGDNITFTLVDQEEFIRQHRRTPSLHDPENVRGLTRSPRGADGKIQHSIFVLNGLTKANFLAVGAHEYTHAWMAEHEHKARQLHNDTTEGFCELIAWKLMEQLGETAEQTRMEKNLYTHGQLQALRAADEAHRFYRVVDWMLDGVDGWLEAGKLDRVFVLRDDAKSAGSAATASATQPAALRAEPPPAPDKLILRGLLGTAKTGRVALINDGMFKVNESARVRLGASNVVVRCLEIRAEAVVVQVEGAAEKQELSVRPR